MSNNRKINDKQKAFAQEYAKNGNNGARAYMDVYGCKNLKSAAACASNLLKNPIIKEYINSLLKMTETATIMDITKRKEMLSYIANTGKYGDRIKAIDTMNKMDNLYVNRNEVIGDLNTNIDLSRLTNEELDKLINDTLGGEIDE